MIGVTGRLPKDDGNISVQVFSPYKIIAAEAGVAVTFASTDIAFRVPDVNTLTISGSTPTTTLQAGSITGIIAGLTYTFTTATSVEVM